MIFENRNSVGKRKAEVAGANRPIDECSPAEKTYIKAVTLRRKMAIWFIALISITELIISSYFLHEVNANSLNSRISREREIRDSGEVRLSTGVYTGDTDFGYFFGDGTFKFNSGAVYEGEWDNNLLSGSGKLRVPSEGLYEGDFKSSQKNGQGTLSWDDGSKYVGEWKDDMMNGQGTYTSASGVKYEGTFKNNDFFEGACVFDNDTGSYVIKYKDGQIDNATIQFKDGTKFSGGADTSAINGTGKMEFVNGDSYDGNYKDGQRDGTGVYIWDSGDKYDGDWSADKMSGTGAYLFVNGSELEGTFKDNSFIDGTYHIKNDFGDYTFTITNGSPTAVNMVLSSGTEYSGEMSGDQLSGQAMIKYSNGDKYDGKVEDGMKSGQGQYNWSGGASYDGTWREDKMSGTGIYFYPSDEDGYKLDGTFEDGLPNGECEYYVSATEHYKTTWENGKCVKVTE